MIGPTSDETTGYHLFIEPTGDLRERLTQLIAQLAMEYGGPVFTPHVTVLARIPDADEGILLATAERVAARMSPQTITFGPLESMGMYFKALYSAVEEQESLMASHTIAAKAFSMDPTSDYRAHLSLLYGNYSEEQIAKTRAELELPGNKSFLADTLSLYNTNGTVDTWYKVQDFRIGR